MASNVKMTASMTAAMLNSVAALLNGGFIQIYSGLQPTTGDSALTTQALLVTCAFSGTAFQVPAGGVAVANPISTGVAVATGIAGWFRLIQNDGVTSVMDGSVGTVGCDLNLATTTVTAADIIGVTGFTLSLPTN